MMVPAVAENVVNEPKKIATKLNFLTKRFQLFGFLAEEIISGLAPKLPANPLDIRICTNFFKSKNLFIFTYVCNSNIRTFFVASFLMHYS